MKMYATCLEIKDANAYVSGNCTIYLCNCTFPSPNIYLNSRKKELKRSTENVFARSLKFNIDWFHTGLRTVP